MRIVFWQSKTTLVAVLVLMATTTAVASPTVRTEAVVAPGASFVSEQTVVVGRGEGIEASGCGLSRIGKELLEPFATLEGLKLPSSSTTQQSNVKFLPALPADFGSGCGPALGLEHGTPMRGAPFGVIPQGRAGQ